MNISISESVESSLSVKYEWAIKKVKTNFPDHTEFTTFDFGAEGGMGIGNGKKGDKRVRSIIMFLWLDERSNTYFDINDFPHKEEWLDARIEYLKREVFKA